MRPSSPLPGRTRASSSHWPSAMPSPGTSVTGSRRSNGRYEPEAEWTNSGRSKKHLHHIGSHCGQLTPASSSTLCSRLTSLVRARIIAFRATRQIPQLRNSRVARN